MRLFRRVSRSRVGAAVVAGVGVLVVALSAPSTVRGSFGRSSTPASGAAVLNHFTPIYMGGQATYTQSQAVALAQQFDVIAEKGGTFTPYISAMHAANPALRIVAYVNGAFDITTNGTAYPSTWYAHDANGNRIQSVAFGNWLMDPTNPQWAPTVANLCSAALASSHDDGCFLDTLGLGPLHPGYVTALPVNPSTHQVYNATAWIAAQTNTVAAVARVARVTVTNGLANGASFPQTNPLLAASHLAMAETWLRISSNPVTAFPTTSVWLADVNMLTYAESHGWGVMTVTKLWTTATAAQVSQWHKFTIASFLMGAGGLSAYNFTTAKTVAGMTATSSYDSVAIGTPTSSYALQGGVYQRKFTNGLAIVNPGTSPVTVVFGASYKNLDGTVVTQETFPPDTGDVLVSNGTPPGMTWDFEDGTTENWAGGNASLAASTAQAYSGRYSLRLTVTSNGGAFALSPHPLSGAAIAPGQSVSLSMHVKAGSVSRYAEAILDWYTATGALISQTIGLAAVSSTTAWTQYSVSGIAPATAAYYAAEYFVGNGSLAGEVSYIDLVSTTVH